jgi:hypothetical protein
MDSRVCCIDEYIRDNVTELECILSPGIEILLQLRMAREMDCEGEMQGHVIDMLSKCHALDKQTTKTTISMN